MLIQKRSYLILLITGEGDQNEVTKIVGRGARKKSYRSRSTSASSQDSISSGSYTGLNLTNKQKPSLEKFIQYFIIVPMI